MKKTRIILTVVMALLSLSLLVSCNKKDPDNTPDTDVVYYTVTFDTNGGGEITAQRVAAGGKVTPPPDPERENYVFDCWTRNSVEWLFDADTVKSDITLSAKWIAADSLFTYQPSEDASYAIITGTKLDSADRLRLPATISGLPVRAVAPSAFAGTSSEKFAEITLPESITIIGEKAFEGCTGIAITPAGKLTEIGSQAFLNCDSLTAVSFGDDLEIIPYEAFAGCSSLKSLVFPSSLKTIEENAFAGCSSVATIIAHGALSTVEDSAFRECSSLKTVFFYGTAEQIDALRENTGKINEAFTDAKFYRYFENKPTEDGNFWHFDTKGSPRVWS